MNTQNKIFAKLESISELQKTKLGAIQDAVNEAVSNRDEIVGKMIDIYGGLYDDIEESLNEIDSTVSLFSAQLATARSEWSELEKEYIEVTSELDSAGIPNNTGYSTLSSDYADIQSSANYITQLRVLRDAFSEIKKLAELKMQNKTN